MILLLLLTPLLSLNCPSLYDYSAGSLICTNACPKNTHQHDNSCCSKNQYFNNQKCQQCIGWVLNNGNTCCNFGQYWNTDIQACLECSLEVYLNGTLCCKGCHYVDMTSSSPTCTPNGQGPCSNLTCLSKQKICCPSGQFFNALQNKCTTNSNLNIQPTRFMGCPSGYHLDYVYRTLLCVTRCATGMIDSVQCASKFCSSSRTQILSLSPPQSNLLSISNNRCCYSIYNGVCVTNNTTCPLRYSYNQFTVCCQIGESYNMKLNNCSFECDGVIAVEIFCVPVGGFIDFSSTPPKIGLQTNGANICNGRILPLGMSICCPLGYYSDGINGCTICYGNIFGVTNNQICCSQNQIYNHLTQSCSTCQGVVDSKGTLCCPKGSYITYNSNGTTTCSVDCPLQSIQNSIYCCLICSANCQTPMLSCATPKLCQLWYFIPNSCNPCSCGTCSSDSSCVECGASLQVLSSCIDICSSNKLFDASLSVCLDCDQSCNGCLQVLSSNNCTSCTNGYYNNAGNCQKCSYKCKTCGNSPLKCTSCYQNSLNSVLAQNNCVPICYQRTYLAGDICISCSSSCQTCINSPNNCLSCRQSFFLSNGICTPCSPPCLSCIDSPTRCLSCQALYAYIPSASSCTLECPSTSVKVSINSEVGYICKLCDPTCLTCLPSPNDCTSCLSGYYLNMTLGTSSCFLCSSGCNQCVNATSCIGQCKVGYYSDSTRGCSVCDISCLGCNGPLPTNCLSCLPGVVLSEGKCFGCDPICLTCLAPTVCTSCTPNLILFNRSCISSCPTSTFRIAQNCLPCSAGCLQCTNSSVCLKCNVNSPLLDQGKCVKNCPSSKYQLQNQCFGCNGTVFNKSSSCCVLPRKVIDDQCVSQNNTITPITPPVNPPVVPTNNQTDQTKQLTYLLPTIKKDKLYITLLSTNKSSFPQAPSFRLIPFPTNKDLTLTNLWLKSSSKESIQNSSTFVSTTYVFQSPNITQKGYLVSSSYDSHSSYSNRLISQSNNAYLKSQPIKYLQIIGITFSVIVLIYASFSKFKGHYIAEESNTLILHTVNFCQIVALFQKIFILPKQIYSFLQGFRFIHFSFFWNPFNSYLPQQYIEPNYPLSLVPDGNFLRQAGFSIAFLLLLLVLFLVSLSVSYIFFCLRNYDQPPFIRKMLRMFFLGLSLCFMNITFWATTSVRYHHFSSNTFNYPKIYNGSYGASIFFLIIIPVLVLVIFLHYYLTYVRQLDQYIYTLRETVQLFQIYFQAVTMGLSVSKYTTLFLILLEVGWLLFNIFIDMSRQPDFRIRLYVISGLIILGYIFLSFCNRINVGTVVMISIIMVSLVVYCSYQIVGIYYWFLCGICGYEAEEIEGQNQLQQKQY